MARNRLAKLLLDDEVANNTGDSLPITKFGVEHIANIKEYLDKRLYQFNRTQDYNPLFEIAKLADLTQNDDLKFKCHSKLADYLYPQIRSLEIQNKESKEVKITIELADYAKPKEIEVQAEEIETEDLDPDKPDYNQMVLGSKKDLG